MNKEEKQKKKNKPMTEDEKLKYEIASELGLLEKVKQGGWKSLTAKETGRIGGLMTKRKKEIMKKQAQN
ncbi:small, acid-soluble spore protein, alpha/beta type [Defluviitalea phaphyphila]|uniref:small, acid-soluble spore protein, alpha/beta type n=1 Tax=Defluviitalea phaphyphila TaxID=1473580 RepID=UPI000A4F36BD|nr:small, acid-soluble spore protein, alpha/beta type [Defluviitalea phaphyphila]